MTAMQLHTQLVVDALKRAVAEALDRKRRLGHYAIIDKDGQPIRVEPEDLPLLKGR